MARTYKRDKNGKFASTGGGGGSGRSSSSAAKKTTYEIHTAAIKKAKATGKRVNIPGEPKIAYDPNLGYVQRRRRGR